MAIYNYNGKCGCVPATTSKTCCCTALQSAIENLQGDSSILQQQVSALSDRDDCIWTNLVDVRSRVTVLEEKVEAIESCLHDQDICHSETPPILCPCSSYTTCGTI